MCCLVFIEKIAFRLQTVVKDFCKMSLNTPFTSTVVENPQYTAESEVDQIYWLRAGITTNSQLL